ncbi:hypothetical protein O181_081057, partial [Austropuccinia psidii MF-1]|nr:hypothetical protein [Austropuccinia psidii MF-1]
LNHFQVAAIEIYQCQYKNWFRAAKEEEWEICPSLEQGAMNSYLHPKSFLGQKETIELLGRWSPFSCKYKVKKIKNWLKNQSLLSIDKKKELETTPALETEGPVESTSSKPTPEVPKDKPKELQKKQKGPTNHKVKGKGKANWHRPYPQGYRIPKLEPSAMDNDICFVNSSFDVELGKFDAKLNKIILDISELKRNDKEYADWYQLTNVRLDSITNTCERIESKCQLQNDEMEDLFILNINDQLRILKDDVLEITKNTNQFATHLAKSDSERQKLKNEIIANVDQIHNNYEPHMPRHCTPLTKGKRSVKGGLTPFLGENVISEKDIPKLEECPTFSGEG